MLPTQPREVLGRYFFKAVQAVKQTADQPIDTSLAREVNETSPLNLKVSLVELGESKVRSYKILHTKKIIPGISHSALCTSLALALLKWRNEVPKLALAKRRYEVPKPG